MKNIYSIIKKGTLVILAILFVGCKSDQHKTSPLHAYPSTNIVGAMKNVMWKGELGPSIKLDTISNKNGLYGLGPESYLTGELLILNGQSYVSRVTSDSTMTVLKTDKVSAPFFVYANVTQWHEIRLDSTIKTIKDIERIITKETATFKKPFAFKLTGTVSKADIHIQNLPSGTSVSSPQEAHQGQTNYELKNEKVTIVGFYSTDHKGIFTHHDTSIHLHLLNQDQNKMGHLDAVEIDQMTLYLPIK